MLSQGSNLAFLEFVGRIRSPGKECEESSGQCGGAHSVPG
jgi:hypothetical protein